VTLYPVICADPPWRYANRGNRSSPEAAGHYETMTRQQIAALAPLIPAADKAVLFLWTTASMLLDGTAGLVAVAWGFEPKQIIPWLKISDAGKIQIGQGNYTRGCAEYLVLAVRGGGPPVKDRGVPGVIMAPRTRHSAKPDASYELIERLYDGPYLEIFARRRWSEAWTATGDQLAEAAC
jgi:N6-adenosine-specific RNA methylase IME4